MNCRQAQDQLADYTAGFVQGEQRRLLQAHLAACETCRDRLAQFRALDRLVSADRPQADETLVRSVMARVQAEPVRPARPWLDFLVSLGPGVAWASGLAVASLVAVGQLSQYLETVTPSAVNWEPLLQPSTIGLVAAGIAVAMAAVVLAANRLAHSLS
jgi:anti-sigma factor RsiW